MNKHQFQIGTIFYTDNGKWRCTDIGTRVIIAIKLDNTEIMYSDMKINLSEQEAEARGLFNGPPYAVIETVFDEYDTENIQFEKPQ